ncbi:hypothetical protein U9M48_037207 [Paspalum notatum var. saurae]|uniref:F-box domain-containing protein n=1 Tax=Paspalum notatum var. saurae TaxID=547442 RepID=A0AAQ3XC64_PASNO
MADLHRRRPRRAPGARPPALPTPTCLFRAAATCKRWRRVIAGDGFLHRFRSRHGHDSHLLLGHYIATTEPWGRKINAEFVPSPPETAIGLTQRVSLDFLIQPGEKQHIQHELTDSRGGLLAFVQDKWDAVVSDPWTRQYRELSCPWGEDLSDDDDVDVFFDCRGAFLVDAGAVDSDDDSHLSSFRLLCACVFKDDYFYYWVESAIFSARDNSWVSSSTFDGGEIEDMWYSWRMDIYDGLVGRVGRSIFWAGGTHLLALDESTGEFSALELPLAPGTNRYRTYHSQNLRVVAGEGTEAVRVVRVVDGDALEVLMASRDHGAWECMVESRVDLGLLTNIEVKPHQSWYFVDTASSASLLVLGVCSPSSDGYLVLTRRRDHEDRSRRPEPEPSARPHAEVF